MRASGKDNPTTAIMKASAVPRGTPLAIIRVKDSP